MGPLRNCNPAGQPTCKKKIKNKKGLVQKCKPRNPTEDSSLWSPNRKTKEKRKRKPKAEARQREWVAFQKKKKKTGVTSLILDTFFCLNSLLTFWLFELFLPLFLTIISNLNCFCLYFKHYHIFLDTQCSVLLLHAMGYCYFSLCTGFSALGTAGFPHSALVTAEFLH